MYKFIAMHCGYVESCKTSMLVYQTDNKYSTIQTAITDLARDMFNKYYEDYNLAEHKLKDCCKATSNSNDDAIFCMKCGRRLKYQNFDCIKFMQFITNLHDTDSDSYGESEFANGENLNWNPWTSFTFMKASKKSIIYIVENAEKVLVSALADIMPELKIDAQYCNHRDWLLFKQEIHPSYT